MKSRLWILFFGVLVAGSPVHADESDVSAPKFVRQWGQEGEANGEFKSPIGIAIDQRDVIYVTEFHGHRVQKFDVDGNFLGRFPVVKHAGGIAVHPTDGRIYVAAMTLHKIAVHDSEGKPLVEFGAKGDGDGQINEPGGLMFSPDSSLYVADQANHRMQVFTPDGKFLRKFGSHGSEPGQFGGLGKPGSRLAGPHFLIFDNDGDIYTTEGAQGRIQKLMADGTPILAWGKNDEGPGGFGGREKAAKNALPGPIGLALDHRGRLWVILRAARNEVLERRWFFGMMGVGV